MDILFWSGGKDSYLALEFYLQEHSSKTEIKLLTTYRETDEVVPHQNIPLCRIREQAEHLNLDLITIPLPENPANEIYLTKVEQALKKQESNIEHLLFGDWHLEDIREWREQTFEKMGYMCLFPIWQKSIHNLLPVLILKPVEVKISAVKKEYQKYIRVGEIYDQRFIRTLPKEIDPMGENGEFHTQVTFADLSTKVV